jgi:hypothetical protein
MLLFPIPFQFPLNSRIPDGPLGPLGPQYDFSREELVRIEFATRTRKAPVRAAS